MHNIYPTKDIKLASCLISLGIPYRESDPVTCEVQEKNGRPFSQYTFWFDVNDEDTRKSCGVIVDAYEKFKTWEYSLDIEHPLYYMIGALINRETFLHWMRNNAEPMKIIQDGNRTVMLSTRASEATKALIKKHL